MNSHRQRPGCPDVAPRIPSFLPSPLCHFQFRLGAWLPCVMACKCDSDPLHFLYSCEIQTEEGTCLPSDALHCEGPSSDLPRVPLLLKPLRITEASACSTLAHYKLILT